MGSKSDLITMTYTNWRGDKRVRHIKSMGKPFWGSNEWHPDPQWLFNAFDASIGEMRTFALKDCNFTKGEPHV